MLEQTSKTSDNGSLHKQNDVNGAHSAAQKMLADVGLHNQSSARDANDKGINDGAVTSDKASAATASQIRDVNNKIIDLVSAHKPIPDSLKQAAIDMHVQSRGQNNDDKSGDVDARAKDLRDVQSEQAVINSDRQLLQDVKTPRSLTDLLNKDIAAKTKLQQNEKQDVSSEVRYAAADDSDNKLNKLVVDALSSRSPQSDTNLKQLLTADNASKNNIMGLRDQDVNLEAVYSSADVRDQALNAELNAALKQELYRPAAPNSIQSTYENLDVNSSSHNAVQQIKELKKTSQSGG